MSLVNSTRALTTTFILGLLALGAGCSKDSTSSGAASTTAGEVTPTTNAATAAAPAAKTAPGATKVGDLPLVADLPLGASPIDGVNVINAEDGSVYVNVKAVTDGDPKDLAAAKQATELFAFKKWVKSDKSADGWVLVWKGVSVGIDGKEGENTAYSVRRKIGNASYDCYGSVKDAANVDKNLKICQSLKPAG